MRCHLFSHRFDRFLEGPLNLEGAAEPGQAGDLFERQLLLESEPYQEPLLTR